MAASTSLRRIASTTTVLPPGTTPSGTRGRILEAALTLFAHTGFHGTSIRAIGAAAGINSATLYSHYVSKQQILHDLVEIGLAELQVRLDAAVKDATTPTDRLRALVHAHVEAHASFTMLATVTNNELYALTPELAAPSLAIRARLGDAIVDLLEEGRREGVFDVADTRLAALAIAGMGINVAAWFKDGLLTPDEVATEYADFALRIAGAS